LLRNCPRRYAAPKEMAYLLEPPASPADDAYRPRKQRGGIVV